MDSTILRDHLMKLHAELAATKQDDPRSAELLAQIMDDIKTLSDPSGPVHRASLPERLEEVAVRFEARHPTLAASSRRLIDMLGKAGL